MVAQGGTCSIGVQVLSGSDSTPVAQADVSVGAVRLRADSVGRVVSTGLTAGVQQLHVRRIGFEPRRAVVPAACAGESTSNIVFLTPRPQTLVRVTVRTDERPKFTGPMAGFWERRVRGDGTFFTTTEIDRRNVQRLGDLLRSVPGWGRSQQLDRFSEALTRGTAVRMGAAAREPVRAAATRCFPTVVIDGMAATMAELNVDGIDPRSLAGVEVYVDGARTPSEFWGTAGQGRCGVVALWSRSYDNLRHTPLEQQLAMIDTIYEPHEVDELARIDDRQPLRVLYPRELQRRRTAGEATVSVVVLPSGEPFLRELRLVSATRNEFGAALLDAMPTLRFLPASRAGSTVTQRAEVTVRFEDGSPSTPRP